MPRQPPAPVLVPILARAPPFIGHRTIAHQKKDDTWECRPSLCFHSAVALLG